MKIKQDEDSSDDESSNESTTASASESNMAAAHVQHGLIPTFVADLTPIPLKFQKRRIRTGHGSQRIKSNKHSLDGEGIRDVAQNECDPATMKDNEKKRALYPDATNQADASSSKGQAPIPYSILQSLDEEEDDDEDNEDVNPNASDDGGQMTEYDGEFESGPNLGSQATADEGQSVSDSQDWSGTGGAVGQDVPTNKSLAISPPQPASFDLAVGDAPIINERQYIQVLIQLADGQFAPVQIPVDALMQGTPSTPPLILPPNSPLTMPVMSAMVQQTAVSPMPVLHTRSLQLTPSISIASSPVALMPSLTTHAVVSAATQSPSILMPGSPQSIRQYPTSQKSLISKLVPSPVPHQPPPVGAYSTKTLAYPRTMSSLEGSSPERSSGSKVTPTNAPASMWHPASPTVVDANTRKRAHDAAASPQVGIASSTRQLLSAKLQTSQQQTARGSLQKDQTNISPAQYVGYTVPGSPATKVPKLDPEMIVPSPSQSASVWSPTPGGSFVTLQAADTSTHCSVDDNSSVAGDSRGDEDEEEKQRKRHLDSNRASANRSRSKKKTWVNNLEEKTNDLQAENKQIMKEMARLKSDIAILKHTLEEHKNCPTSYSYT